MDPRLPQPSAYLKLPHTAPLDSLMCRRNRARFLFGIMRLRRGLDPANPFDAELADAIDVETDRLSHLMRGCR